MGYRTAIVGDTSLIQSAPWAPPASPWSPIAQLSLLLGIASGMTSVHEASRRHGLAEEEVLQWQDAFTSGAQASDAETCAASLGALRVTSGQLALVDALGAQRLHAAEVPAGTHRLTVGTYAGAAAYVLVQVSEEGVAQWTQGPTVEVRSGVAGLADEALFAALDDAHQGHVANAVLHERAVATLFRREGARAGEVAAVASGHLASVRIGRDGFGDVACVLVDFHRVDDSLARGEASEEDLALVGSLSSFFSSGLGNGI